MKKNRTLAGSLMAIAFSLSACSETADSGSVSETEAVIGNLGLGCKNRVLEQFDVPNSDITVRLGATLQQDIESGAMTVADLKKDGASFNWEVSGKNASGYCNVDGSGTITEFQQL